LRRKPSLNANTLNTLIGEGGEGVGKGWQKCLGGTTMTFNTRGDRRKKERETHSISSRAKEKVILSGLASRIDTSGSGEDRE